MKPPEPHAGVDIEDMGWPSTIYEVEPEETDAFVDLQRQAHDIYVLHAEQWSLARSHEDSMLWCQFGPHFREAAAFERAVAAFTAVPGLLTAIAAFRRPHPEDTFAVAIFFRTDDVVFRVGDRAAAPAQVAPDDPSPALRKASRLAAALSARIAPHLPEGFSLEARHEALVLWTVGFNHPITWWSLVDSEPVDAVLETLDKVQDELAEETSIPWPHDEASGYVFHEYDAEAREGQLRFWYGPRDRPVLQFEPIPLADLED